MTSVVPVRPRAARSCQCCPEPTSALHGLCPACLTAAAIASSRAQGLPDRVEDVGAIERVATIFRDAAAVREMAS